VRATPKLDVHIEDGVMPILQVALFVAAFLLVSHLHGTVYAYLDPGTGSIAIQVILGGVVALLATLKLYWARVVSWAHRKPAPADAVAPEHR
jgi:hypothetical protein